MLGDGAYAGLISGDLAAHDHIVAAILEEMIRRNEVIHLARSPMARVAAGIWPVPAVPILTSARLAVGRLAQVLQVSAGEAAQPITALLREDTAPAIHSVEAGVSRYLRGLRLPGSTTPIVNTNPSWSFCPGVRESILGRRKQ